MIVPLLLAAVSAPSSTAPALDLAPLVPLVVGAVLMFLSNLIIQWVKDRGGRVPTMVQVWQRMDLLEQNLQSEREARQATDGRYFTLRRVFMAYVGRVQAGGPHALTAEERELLDQPEPESADDLDPHHPIR